jgi:glucose/arabinose dehydrogenase
MKLIRKVLLVILVLVLLLVAVIWWNVSGTPARYTIDKTSGPRPELVDPDPQMIPQFKVGKTVGWTKDEKPVAAPGLAVTRFADGLNHPRTVVLLPNGDVLAAETNSPAREYKGVTGMVEKYLMKRIGAGDPSPNKLVLLRDANRDGVAEQRFEMGNAALNSPYGMVFRDGRLIVANTDAVLSFPYALGQTTLDGKPEKLMDLPGGGNHWARNLLLSPDGNLLYIAVGSASNIAEGGIEREKGRAAIWEYDFTKKRGRQFASGLRNPNGLDWNPATGELWTVVNERDQLGPDLVPDYLTNVPFGASYGWPWVYWKKNIDWRIEDPMPDYFFDYVRKPEYALGAHTAPLGLAFARGGNLIGPKFAGGAFIARHGSWNRRPVSGYDVVWVAFDERGNVKPQLPVTVLSGFLSDDGSIRGRPTWVAFAADGALLVSDDVGGVIWRVTAPGAAPAQAIVPIISGVTPSTPPKIGNTIARPNADSDLMKPDEQGQ